MRVFTGVSEELFSKDRKYFLPDLFMCRQVGLVSQTDQMKQLAVTRVTPRVLSKKVSFFKLFLADSGFLLTTRERREAEGGRKGGREEKRVNERDEGKQRGGAENGREKKHGRKKGRSKRG